MSSQEICKLLIEQGCLSFCPSDPITYTSGLKGPLYCDNRLMLSSVAGREKIVQGFSDVIESNKLEFDALVGLATAGIPWGAWLADKTKDPYGYVRSKAKSHGKGNQIEGLPRETGMNLLLVEDLINQGKSLGEAVDVVEKAGHSVVGCLAIVNYQMPASVALCKERELNVWALTDFSAMTESALELGKIDESEKELLKKWQSDPINWCP